MDNPIERISAAQLAVEAGLTDGEIAAELDLTIAQVQRLPELQAARLGPVHAARVERSLYEASLPGVTWKEANTLLGTVRLESERRPDTAAAKALLAAIEPGRYGAQVSVSVSVSLASDLAAARLRAGIIDGVSVDITPQLLTHA
jgi:hypothetical protein